MARNALWLDIQDQLVAERAGTREAAASDLVGDMNGSLVVTSHTQHEASTLVVPVSSAYEGDEAQQGGGGAHSGECYADWRDLFVNPFLLCDSCLDLWREAPEQPRLTWLERIARRWPLRVVQ